MDLLLLMMNLAARSARALLRGTAMRMSALLAALFFAACGGPESREAPASPATISPEPAPAAPPAVETAPPANANPPAACEPSSERLCPVDEGERDASFSAYRAQLRDIVRRRDAEALLAAIDPAIRTGFGPGGGIDDFRAQWKPDAEDSKLWSELASILENGGAFRGEGESRSFWAPYVYAAWPEGKDAFTHVAALRADVAVRERPDASSPVLGTVHWAILELILREGRSPFDAWMEVRLPDGRTGFVRNEDVRGPIEWRAGFMKQKGAWKMVALVAGD